MDGGDWLDVNLDTQGVYPDRAAIAEMLGLPPAQVRVSHRPGPCCYGHDSGDDAAADGALIVRAYPSRTIRLSSMREQLNSSKHFGFSVTPDVVATLNADRRITHGAYDLWSSANSARSGGAGNVLPVTMLGDAVAIGYPDLRIAPPA